MSKSTLNIGSLFPAAVQAAECFVLQRVQRCTKDEGIENIIATLLRFHPSQMAEENTAAELCLSIEQDIEQLFAQYERDGDQLHAQDKGLVAGDEIIIHSVYHADDVRRVDTQYRMKHPTGEIVPLFAIEDGLRRASSDQIEISIRHALAGKQNSVIHFHKSLRTKGFGF